MDVPVFSYMRWAKRHSGACRYDLTASSAPGRPLPDLPDPAGHRQMPVGDGDPRCESLIAARYGVPESHVLFVPGSTLGNYLLASALVTSNRPVLVESPVYENLPGLVRLFGGQVVPVTRAAADGYRVDPALVAEGFRAGARLLLLTDLHNPTGAHLADADLEEIREIAARHGARVILDEVYRDFLPGVPGTAYRADDDTVLVATSLTKVYGLGSLRTGWVLAPPALREHCQHLLDYITVIAPSAVAAAMEQALRDIGPRQEEARAVAATGVEILRSWVEERGDVDWVRPAAGVVSFPRFEGIADTAPLCEWLMAERDVAVVPGHFFGDRARVRIGHSLDLALLAEGLSLLGEGIDRCR